MTSSENKLITQIGQKLGLADHDQLVPKSTELLRLLQIKSSGVTNALGDYAKATICMDLASSLLGLPFDNETALKLSGLKKSVYVNNKRTIEKILDMTKSIGIPEICIQLGLNQVQKEAAGMLEEYKRFVDGNNAEIDFAHPQYAAMAVFQACKKLKVKPQKTKLVPFSHLKPAQWTMLEKNWERFLASSNVAAKANVISIVSEDPVVEKLVGVQGNALKHSSPEKIEPYTSWKKRMLEKAYRELKVLEQAR